MKIIGLPLIEAFAKKHPPSRAALKSWYTMASTAAWTSLADVKKTFRPTDLYRHCTIFDIGGNKYRLIAHLDYSLQVISIGHILTHAEYDKEKWKRHC